MAGLSGPRISCPSICGPPNTWLADPDQTKPNHIKPKRKEKQFRGCDIKFEFTNEIV